MDMETKRHSALRRRAKRRIEGQESKRTERKERLRRVCWRCCGLQLAVLGTTILAYSTDVTTVVYNFPSPVQEEVRFESDWVPLL